MPPRPSSIAVEPHNNRADMIVAEYAELRDLAAAKMRSERVCHTLTGTALANEVAAKMLDNSQTPAKTRGQFLAFANKAMRHYLIDYARARRREKRGGDRQKFEFNEADVASEINESEEHAALHEVLQRLGQHDQRRAEVVRLRYLEGRSNEEIAELLNTSLATVKRDWIVARAWLANELKSKG